MPPSQGGTAEIVNRIFILPPSQDTSRPVLKTSFEGGSWGPSRSFQSGVLCVERGYSVANMKTKMQELETFLEKANVGLAQGSVLNTDSADAEVRATLEKGQAFVRMADTHKAGMTVARKRWDALLGK